MNQGVDGREPLVVLMYARKVANHAHALGVLEKRPTRQFYHDHIGAVLADAILQPGINYQNVVLPRVRSIVERYPEAHHLAGVQATLDKHGLPSFLVWKHPTKLQRFSTLLSLLVQEDIQTVHQLRLQLNIAAFRFQLLELRGIGPKTVDYLSCLAGNDNIAVDRHIRSFAQDAGVDAKEYATLQLVFSYAADLLAIPRRDLDWWVWMTLSGSSGERERLKLPY